jgi:hypothetical protein
LSLHNKQIELVTLENQIVDAHREKGLVNLEPKIRTSNYKFINDLDASINELLKYISSEIKKNSNNKSENKNNI